MAPDMADERFHAAIDALYRAIDLPAPLRDEVADGVHAMIAGEHEVTVATTPSGEAVRVTGTVGTLSDDPVRRADEARAVLRSALGLAATNVACVSLDGAGGDSGRRVVAEAVVLLPREARAVPGSRVGAQLKAAIEDVIEQIEWQGAHLSGVDNPLTPHPTTHAPSPSAEGAGTMIFRP